MNRSKSFLMFIALCLGVICQAQDSSHIDHLKFEAQQFVLKKQYTQAIENYTQLSKIYEGKQDWANYLEVVQSLANWYNKSGQRDQAIEYTKSILNQVFSSEEWEIRIEGAMFFRLGYLYYLKGDYVQAKSHYLSALDAHENLPSIPDSLQANCYAALGSTNYMLAEYDEAMLQAEKALEINIKTHGEHHIDVADNYNLMASVCMANGAYLQAIGYYENVRMILANIVGESSRAMAIIYGNLAEVYREIKELDKALIMGSKSLEIYEQLYGKGSVAGLHAQINVGATYMEMGKLEQSEKAMQQAIEISSREQGKKHPDLIEPCVNLAWLYIRNKDFKKATEFIHKAENIALIAYPSHRHPSIAEIYYTRAKIEMAQANYKEALDWVQRALIAGTLDYNVLDKRADLGSLVKHHTLLSYSVNDDVFYLRADIFEHLYEESKDLFDLKSAYSTIAALVWLIDHACLTFPTDEDKAYLLRNAHQAYERGIHLAFRLYELTGEAVYLREAFGFAERNKSILLRDVLRSEKALKFGKVPKKLIEYEQRLKGEIADLEKSLLDAQLGNSTLNFSDIQFELFEKKRAKEFLIDSLEKNYPKYYQLKYKWGVASVENLREQGIVSQNTVLLEYFVGSQATYLFELSADTLLLHRIAIGEQVWKEKIKRFHNQFTNLQAIRDSPQQTYNSFTQQAHNLYQDLFASLNLGAHENKHLNIVTDNWLGYIPFEVLLVEAAQSSTIDYKNLDYLLQHHSISYGYSATLLLENRTSLSPDFVPNTEILAFAANYENPKSDGRSEEIRQLRDALINLPGAEREVAYLDARFKGAFMYKEAATEAAFKDAASEFGILHLAMHGLLDKNNPMASLLAFSENGDSTEDNLLYAYELSNLDLNAQLVVLSACETGFGKYEQGEGVMSLARSFMYAGTPTLVVSLWQVNDYSSAKIMDQFYKNLVKHKTTAEALRLAKLHYIEQAESIDAHPAFWAPFVAVGDNKEVKISVDAGMLGYSIGLGIFVFVMGVLLISQRIQMIRHGRVLVRKSSKQGS